MNDTHDEYQENESPENFKYNDEVVLTLPELLLKSVEISNKWASAYQPLFQQPEALQRMQETLSIASRFADSFVTAQQNVQDALYSPAMQQMIQGLATVPKLYYDFNNSPMVAGLRSLIESDAFRTSVLAAQRIYDSVAAIYDSPVLKWIQSFDFNPLLESLKGLSIPELDPEKIKQVYLHEMYEAHWFPGSIWSADLKLTIDVIDVIGSTRKSKNRVRRIDSAVYGYYTKTIIEGMKKDWRKMGLPEHLMRILHQAVQAYHRKEYAITVIVLSTQWEGIIYSKAHDNGRKKTEKTKRYLAALAEQNNYLEIFKSYYDEFIMYNCNSPAETIIDVPGRNSAAHSFYESYPTRKAALNAILFTDFLLNLEPLEEENIDG
jgi:hypothetical protein